MTPRHTVGIGVRKAPRVVSRIGPPRNAFVMAELEAAGGPDGAPASRETPWFRSAAALGLAAAAHALLVVLAAAIVLAERKEVPPLVEVVPPPPVVEKDEPEVLPEKSRPSVAAATAGSAADVLFGSAADVSIPVPEVVGGEVIDFGGAGVGAGFGSGFGGGVGKLGGTDFFGVPTGEGVRSIAFVLDVSGSMAGIGEVGLEGLKEQVSKTLSGLDPRARFNIFAFASDADGFQARSISATRDHRELARKFLAPYFRYGNAFLDTRTSRFGDAGTDDRGLRYIPIVADDFEELEDSFGATRVELGVLAAMRDKPEVVFVLSDGEPSSHINGRTVTEKVLITLVENYRDRTYGRNAKFTIHTIGVGGIGAGGKKFLRRLASAFGGAYRDVDLGGL